VSLANQHGTRRRAPEPAVSPTCLYVRITYVFKMTEAITCPRCEGRGELESYAYKGASIDPREVRLAKQALREAYGLEQHLPSAPSSEDVLVALARELSETDLPERPA
jgi:hypothetical protein